jgi:UMP-CMP kinase
MASRMPLSWRLAGRFASSRSVGPFSAGASSRTPLSWVARTASRRGQQQQQRFYSSEGGSTGNKAKVKFWPFIAVIAVGSAGYVALVNRRKGLFLFSPLSPKRPDRVTAF